MKTILTILAIIFLIVKAQSQINNYYISTSDINANDDSIGSISAPWKSFIPLNAVLLTNSNVDTIFLKCGDIFRDQVIDSLVSNFVITSYGSGNKPVISGADVVSGWTYLNPQNYYQAIFTKPVTNFFVTDKEQVLARMPDEGSYYNIMNNATATSLTSITSLANTTVGSKVCIHTKEWCWEKSSVTTVAGSTINYLPATMQVPTINYKFFIYDDLSYLNASKEWYYNANAQIIYYKLTTANPNSLVCEASVRPYGILLGNSVQNITIRNITFEKQTESGIGILHFMNKNITVDNCYFARQYNYGINLKGKNVEIKNSYFREVDGLAIFINGSASKALIHHNTFRNNGGYRNSGIGTQINLSTIKGAFVDSCHIHHNNIDSAGYCGIAMDGMNNLIERNIIKNAMLLNSDGAALKTFGLYSQNTVYRNNFVSKSDGNTEGTPLNGTHFLTPAIYFDFSTNNCTIQENTIYDRINKGIFFNAGNFRNSAIGNVVYGGNISIDFNGFPHATIQTDMTEMKVKNNTFFAKNDSAVIFRMYDNTDGFFTSDLIDSNYYFQPYDESKFMLLAPSTTSFLTLTQWQTNSGFDFHSKNSFVNWVFPTSFDTLIMNQSDDIITVNLGVTKYLDLDSNDVCGSLTLQPYTSKILINTNTNCTTTTNMLEHNDNKLIIFPNPTANEITIQTNDKTATKYNITNNLGEIVACGILFNGASKVLLTHLATGMYYIQIVGNLNQTIKIWKN